MSKEPAPQPGVVVPPGRLVYAILSCSPAVRLRGSQNPGEGDRLGPLTLPP